MAHTLTFTAYDPKKGTPLLANVPVKVYEVASTGLLAVTASTTVYTNKLGLVTVGGLDDSKFYDAVVQTIPFVHFNGFEDRQFRNVLVSSLNASSMSITNISVTGIATIATGSLTNLVVSGISTTGGLSVATNAVIVGTLTVTGAVSMRSTIDVTGALAVTGATRLLGAVNLGAGTGAAWSYFTNVIEAPSAAVAFGPTQVSPTANAYYDGAWKRKSLAAAGRVVIANGTVDIMTAASGAANSAITWITALSADIIGTIAVPGGLNVGTATGAVTGQIRASAAIWSGDSAASATFLGSDGRAAATEGVTLFHDGTETWLKSFDGTAVWHDLTVQLEAFRIDCAASATDNLVLTSSGLSIKGTGTFTGAFGCNTKAAQTAYVSGGALAAYVTGVFGLDSAANMSALHAMVVKIRAALVANGIMS